MTEPSNWLERYYVLLPISVMVVVLVWVSTRDHPAPPLVWVSLLMLLAAPVMAGAAGQAYRSREDARWSAVGWLPLRGRWLCYFVSALLALPLTLAGVFVAHTVITRW